MTTLVAHAQTAAPAETDTAKWKTVEEHWYIMEIGGDRVGWSASIVETDGSRFRTIDRSMVRMNRGNVVVSISNDLRFVESADATPISIEQTQEISSQVMHTVWEFHADRLVATTTQGGREVKKDSPLPKGPWLTPRAAEKYTDERIKAGDQEIKLTTLEVEDGLSLVTSTSRRESEEKLEVNGQQVPVTVWRTTASAGSMKDLEAIAKYDARGVLVHQEISSGLGKIVTRLSSREAATAEPQGQGPDFFARTFIKPDRAIHRSTRTVASRLKITAREGTLPSLPSAGAQLVEMSDDRRSAVLDIDLSRRTPAVEAEQTDPALLADSAMLDINDPLVQTLAKNGVKRAGGDALARAEALRKLVNRHISKKGFATAFASASETARTRTGDCSEHGVLLCALLRANGIPARVASGLLYVEDFMNHSHVFGWHMWTQALIDGAWVDLDATLPRRSDATHILTSTSTLSDGLGSGDMGPLLQLVGNLDVHVLEIRHDDDRPPAASPQE